MSMRPLVLRHAMILVCLLSPLGTAAGDSAQPSAEERYAALCASCHGATRYGGYSPPLVPNALNRKTDDELLQVILHGRPSTQMPGFAQQLDEPSARALVALLRTSVGVVRWGPKEIEASRVEFSSATEGTSPRIPPEVNRDNLTLVVERGTRSISVLDGDSFRELDRFPVGDVHGGLKFDQSIRSVFASTRDGTLVRYDLTSGHLAVKAKVGVNTRNVAVSPDGAYVAVANQLPEQLVILDRDLHPLAVLPLAGQPSGVYQAPGESAFVLTLRNRSRLIRIPYPELRAEETRLPESFEDFMFVPGRREILASSRDGNRIRLYDLESMTVKAVLDTDGLPHLFSACFFRSNGILYAALNHIGVARITILDLDELRIAKQIEIDGTGYFTRTHPSTPYVWVDTNSEAIQLIDKRTLELVERKVVPSPGKIAMHVEFTADGDRALVSVWDQEGAVVAYDSRTLEEHSRIPYAMPVGKYNARNKTIPLE